MILDEIFDSEYTLKRVDDGTLYETIKDAFINDGYDSLSILQASEDSTQIFIVGVKDAAWEVHHTVAEPGKLFVSGEIISGNRPANPKFISTAMKIYKNKLDRLNRIRVVAVPVLWKTYKKVIDREVDMSKYDIGKPMTIVRGNTEMVAQEISPKSKLESLSRKTVPV